MDLELTTASRTSQRQYAYWGVVLSGPAPYSHSRRQGLEVDSTPQRVLTHGTASTMTCMLTRSKHVTQTLTWSSGHFRCGSSSGNSLPVLPIRVISEHHHPRERPAVSHPLLPQAFLWRPSNPSLCHRLFQASPLSFLAWLMTTPFLQLCLLSALKLPSPP